MGSEFSSDYYAQEVAASVVQAQMSWDLLTVKASIKSAASVGNTTTTVEVQRELPDNIVTSFSDYGIELITIQQDKHVFKYTFDISEVGR